jgi:hypothetical protein
MVHGSLISSAPRRKRRVALHPGHEIALSPEQLVNRRSGRQPHRPAGAANPAAADVGGDLGKLRRQHVGLAKFDVGRNDAGWRPSTRSRERSFEAVGHFNIDFKRRYVFAPLHPDHDFFRIEHDMPRDHRQDLCPQQFQQFRLAAQAAFMRQEYLQPFPCNRRGSSTATDEP